jgi:hypothetical protein
LFYQYFLMARLFLFGPGQGVHGPLFPPAGQGKAQDCAPEAGLITRHPIWSGLQTGTMAVTEVHPAGI